MFAEWIEACATLAMAEEDAQRAARLFGAAIALRKDVDAPLAPKDEAGRTRAIEALRTELGENRLEVEMDLGRSMIRPEIELLALDRTTHHQR